MKKQSICGRLQYEKLERVVKLRIETQSENLLEEKAYEIWVRSKATYNSPDRNYKPGDWKRLTNLHGNTRHLTRAALRSSWVWLLHGTLKSSQLLAESVAKQPSLASLIRISMSTQLEANRQPACLSAKFLSRRQGLRLLRTLSYACWISGASQRMARYGSQTPVESKATIFLTEIHTC